MIAIALEDDRAGMIGLEERGKDLGIGIGEVDLADLVPRRHHGADRQIAKPHDARDHLLFAGLQHAGAFSFHDKRPDFILADLAFGFAALAEDPQQHFAGAIEQPHQRQREFRHQNHRRRDLHRDRFGIAQRDLLGHELADDQGSIGDDADDEAHADGVGECRREACLEQPMRQALSKCGTGEGARQHADQSDADLHRGKEFAGIGGQRQRGPRADDAFLDQPASLAGRDETIANSDIDSNPLMTIRIVTIASSRYSTLGPSQCAAAERASCAI